MPRGQLGNRKVGLRLLDPALICPDPPKTRRRERKKKIQLAKDDLGLSISSPNSIYCPPAAEDWPSASLGWPANVGCSDARSALPKRNFPRRSLQCKEASHRQPDWMSFCHHNPDASEVTALRSVMMRPACTAERQEFRRGWESFCVIMGHATERRWPLLRAARQCFGIA